MAKFIFDNERWVSDINSAQAKKGISLRKMSSKVGLSASSLCRIKTGGYEPRISDFMRICAVLDLEAITYFDENDVQMKMF